MDTIGHHYIAEASGCKPDVIGKVEAVERILVRAAEVAGVKVWSISFDRFDPNAFSAVVKISDSHIFLHTWPQASYVTIDIFHCGDSDNPDKTVQCAVQELSPQN